jgi:hypothetical protein
MKMSGIFVNYRSGGSHSVAVAALAERLAHHFGADEIFVDHQMLTGVRYNVELEERLAASDVLVAVISEGWATAWKPESEKDWVRYEIATALATGKQVVPVLLEDVARPTRDQLPPDIAGLALRQDTRLRAARFAEDFGDLAWVLERHVTAGKSEPPPRREPRPKRVVWAFLGALLAGLVLPAARWLGNDFDWVAFAAFAVMLTIFMALGVLMQVLLSLIRLSSYRHERRYGEMPYRLYLRKIWVVIALGFVAVVHGFLDFVKGGDTWRITVVLVTLVGLAYYAHQVSMRRNNEDTEWPPLISTEPHIFRRAAARLHERLTTWPEWRRPRSRLHQDQAVEVYLALAQVRLDLRDRAADTWSRWLAARRSGAPALSLGVATSAVAYQITALALLGPAPLRIYVFSGVVFVLAPAFAVLASVIEHRTERKHLTWLVAELTEWQAKTGPVVFEH